MVLLLTTPRYPRLVPLLDKVFRRNKRSVGRRWCVDETYIKVKGQ